MKRIRFGVFLAVLLPVCTGLLAAPPPAAGQELPQDISRAFSAAGVQMLKQKPPLSDFTLPLLSGGTQSLDSLRGKVVFLNFWATWCPPCRAEMPAMEKLYQKFKNDGLAFFTVNIQEDKKDVEAFMKEFGLSFPVALDFKGEAAAMYGVRGIPTTYIIDRDGRIIAAAVGGREWDSAEMLRAFTLLMRND
ncbi:MAG: TlpA family protein disulfide reductase [Spirochaetales bacterium]|jgi:thiol-disulfide isomerase/thioredoxin|nr:TlpA family protein disulfide reductase [Spirochaetales bacterium]